MGFSWYWGKGKNVDGQTSYFSIQPKNIISTINFTMNQLRTMSMRLQWVDYYTNCPSYKEQLYFNQSAVGTDTPW